MAVLFRELDSERLQRVEHVRHQTLAAALIDWRFERVDDRAFKRNAMAAANPGGPPPMIAVSEWRKSWDIEHAILPIADILSASSKWLCALPCGSFRRSRPTPRSNMRILPRSESFTFRRWILTVPPSV
jgi:hypothetical protein